MAAGKGKEKLLNMARAFGAMVLAAIVCLPVTFTVQRTIPALVSDPYMYEFEDFRDPTLRGRKLNSVEFMRVGRFIDLFADRVLGIPEGTFDFYGEIAEYKRTHGISEGEETGAVTLQEEVEIPGVLVTHELVASTDYTPEELEMPEEDEDDYTNGRIDIFRSYIEQLNMTGHEEMGALLKDGSIATHAHNIYLQVAYDHGIPVGILFVLVGMISFVKAWIYFGKKRDIITYAALPAVVIAAVGAAGMVEWVFHLSHPCGLILMLVLAPLVFGGEQEEKEN